MSARSVYPQGSPPISIAHEDWQPPVADAALLAGANAQIGRLEDYLAPIDRKKLVVRILGLLQDFWVPEVDDLAREVNLQMWVNGLAEFPEWAVEEALQQRFNTSEERPKTVAPIRQLCRALTGDASVEQQCLRRLVDPWEQEQARARQAEADAVRQRAAEREAFNAANPDWTLGLPRSGQRERPIEPEPHDPERRRAALESLKGFRLLDADDPRVVEAMRQMEDEEARGRGSHDD
jgi:hypothetical protein